MLVLALKAKGTKSYVKRKYCFITILFYGIIKRYEYDNVYLHDICNLPEGVLFPELGSI